MRIVDKSLLDEFRKKKLCEWCGNKDVYGRPLQPHHLFARGMGGGSRLDVRCNLIALCGFCHDKAHCGAIARSQLIEKAAVREGITENDLVDEIHRLQRRDKREAQPERSEGTRGRRAKEKGKGQVDKA